MRSAHADSTARSDSPINRASGQEALDNWDLVDLALEELSACDAKEGGTAAQDLAEPGEAVITAENTVPAARVQLFGVPMDAVNFTQAMTRLWQWLRDDQAVNCRYVVTPNVDHTVLLQKSRELRAAYHDADLVVADGWPVVLASRLARRPLPQRVPGSDLVPALMSQTSVRGPLRVFLLGAAEGVADRAAARIQQRWPRVEVVGTYSPPLGFEHNPHENECIFAQLDETRPDLLVVGLGAPKQELWVHSHRSRLAARVAICAGATIDFLAGEKRRAPRWVRAMYLEWLHRMLSEPRRLGHRYARDALIFPRLVLREIFRRGDH